MLVRWAPLENLIFLYRDRAQEYSNQYQGRNGRYWQPWGTSRYESNGIIRFDEPIFHTTYSSDFVCLLRDAVHPRVFCIVHVTVQ